MIKNNILSHSDIENARNIFKLYDKDYDGYITASEFTKISEAFGDKLQKKEIDDILGESSDKKLSLEGEFFIYFFIYYKFRFNLDFF